MMLKKVSTHRQMYSLATNMVNAANLTWNTSGQCMLPLRWGAAHRAVIQTIRSALHIENRNPLPSTINEVARQVVDAVEWGNSAYQLATPEELNAIVKFLKVELLAWLKAHFITEMANGTTLEKCPGRVKSVRAIHSVDLLTTLQSLNPELVVTQDNGDVHLVVKRVNMNIKTVTQELLATAIPITRRIRALREDTIKDINHFKKETQAANGLIILSNDISNRTVPCLLPKEPKLGKRAEWVIFNMPTEQYVHRLKLRMPLTQY